MRLNRKWILVLSLLMSVAMATSGTLAYMTDIATKTNTFTIGNVSIELDEPSWEDKSVLYPGALVAKDPVITNTGRNNAFVWMEVSIPTDLYDYIELKNLGYDWTMDEDTAVDGANTIVTLRYQKPLAPEATSPKAFTQVMMDADIDNDFINNYANEVNIVVTAYAIESDVFTNANEAYMAYKNEDATLNQPEPDTELSVDSENENVYLISDAADLFGFAKMVNEGDSFSGKTVKLTSDINLSGYDWTPIGTVKFTSEGNSGDGKFVVEKAFKGTFDGQNHKISNLKIHNRAMSGAALFGCVDGATIQNVNMENVDIKAYSTAAAIAGYTTGKSTIENCNVSGSVKIDADWAYVAGIAAYGVFDISGCDVIASESSTITSRKNAVGGIMGWMNNGGKIQNCNVKNLKLTGWTNIGGLSGFLSNQGEISGCSVENVNMTKTREDGVAAIGYAMGGWTYSASSHVTVSGNSFTNVSRNGQAVDRGVGTAYPMYGADYGAAVTPESYFVVTTENTTTNCTNNVKVI